jgi:hypothetical protein
VNFFKHWEQWLCLTYLALSHNTGAHLPWKAENNPPLKTILSYLSAMHIAPFTFSAAYECEQREFY